MSTDDLARTDGPSSRRVASRRMESPPKWILVGWVVAGAALTLWFLDLNSDAGEWADLVNVVALMFFVASLVTVGITYVIVRFMLAGNLARSLVSLVGPPALFGLLALLVRLS